MDMLLRPSLALLSLRTRLRPMPATIPRRPMSAYPDQPIFDFEDFSVPLVDFDDDPKPAYDFDYSDNYFANWINDPDLLLAPSSPIPIPLLAPSSPIPIPPQPQFSYSERVLFPQNPAISPTDYLAVSPASSEDPYSPRQRVESISPLDTTFAPVWPSPRVHRSPSSSRPSVRHSPMVDTTVRQRIPSLRGSVTSPLLFTSTSAPESHLTRSYSRVSGNDDPDATLRRKKRISPPPLEASARSPNAEPGTVNFVRMFIVLTNPAVLKSVLRPPKLAPSAWQLYFTDWIQNQQVNGTRKLNVAQAAKEAGQEYASLTEEEKEATNFSHCVTSPADLPSQPYKRRSQAAKEARERELAAYMRSLTPDDIKRENQFRAAQRKAGKSRKSNIKDPNAPKKPLSAYFMFLQRIRANPQLVRNIFGDETETTKQSVLAAAKWRSMTDAERQVSISVVVFVHCDSSGAK
ncbi:hypothetical protein C0992_005928 [Termitomyces sp. T32_za158]|nr:hypothetical protein C0992_005928 [Termitomyces sp. T32_za158]